MDFPIKYQKKYEKEGNWQEDQATGATVRTS